MNNDRELLELAAKAAGYRYSDMLTGGLWVSMNKGKSWQVWNPLTDDGDALRLAVKLDMSIISCMEEKEVGVTVMDTFLEIYEQHNDDPYAATRRAIVRAAAEIGRTE